MAIFASTTLSNYSDPYRALTLKALEKRQADMANEMATAQVPKTETAIGAAGAGLGAIGDVLQKRAVDRALATGRDELAGVISGIDPVKGPTPQQAALLARRDPDLYGKFMENQYKTGAQQSLFTHQDAQAAAEVQARKDAAAQKAKDDEAAAVAAEERLRARPQTDLARLTESLGRKPTEEEVKASIEKLTAPSATEMKAGNALQDAHLETQSALGDLKEARALMGPNGTGIRAGAGGGLAQTGAKWGGDYLGLSDPEMTKRTERYNQIMNADAIISMSKTLKGASTDFEMREFVKLMNDPNAELSTKAQALDKMIAKAEAYAALQAEQLKRAKVPVPAGPAAVEPKVQAAPGTAAAPAPAPAAADPNAAAKAWLADPANANSPYYEGVKKKLGM